MNRIGAGEETSCKHAKASSCCRLTPPNFMRSPVRKKELVLLDPAQFQSLLGHTKKWRFYFPWVFIDI